MQQTNFTVPGYSGSQHCALTHNPYVVRYIVTLMSSPDCPCSPPMTECPSRRTEDGSGKSSRLYDYYQIVLKLRGGGGHKHYDVSRQPSGLEDRPT